LVDAVNRADVDRARALLQSDPGLAGECDGQGVTALHLAALRGNRDLVQLLLDRGADINARDGRFGATPAGWMIEFLREQGAYLAIELDDFAFAIDRGDEVWVRRFLERFPALREAHDPAGVPFRERAHAAGKKAVISLFS
jgi:ankyrin repeat protein